MVLLPATTALVRLAPPSFLAAYTFHFKQKQKLDEAALKAQLTLAGYTHVSQVVSPGEYAVRGGLIDLFPMGSAVPYRVDLFGDEVDSIRTFDPDSQRSLYPVPEVRLLPGREFPMDEARAQRLPRALAREDGRRPDQGAPVQGHRHRPRHRRHRVLPAAVLRADRDDLRLPRRRRARWCCTARSTRRCKRFWTDTRERHRFLQHDRERPILPPEDAVPEAGGVLHAWPTRMRVLAVRGTAEAEADLGRAAAARPERRARRAPSRWPRLQQHVGSTPHRVLIVAESDGRRESLLELLRDSRIEPPTVASLAEFEASDEHFAIAVAPLAEGFFWFEPERRSRSSSSPKPSSSPPRPPRAGAASRSRSATSTR